MSNMYNGVKTWNPIGGKCPHDCFYCSTKAMSERFYFVHLKYSGELRLDESALKKGLGKGNLIFVAAQHDLFAADIPGEWIRIILEKCKRYDNKYLFQSKNPARFMYYIHLLPPRSILCTTIETNRRYHAMGKTPDVAERAQIMQTIKGIPKWVTIEPIMRFDLMPFVDLIISCEADQINIGADSKGNFLIEPSKDDVRELISVLRDKGQNVVIKDNLRRLL